MGEDEKTCGCCGRAIDRCDCHGGPYKKVIEDGKLMLAKIEEEASPVSTERPPPAKCLPRGEFAAGLLIIAADAVERANKKIVDDVSPLFVLEDVLEGLAALIEEMAAHEEECVEFLVDEANKRSIDDPEKLREVLARTLRRRWLRI